MVEKTWSEMDGWEKTWEVTKVVGPLALLALGVLGALSGGGAGGAVRRSGTASGSVWTVGHGGKKGYGSWSSFRHG